MTINPYSWKVIKQKEKGNRKKKQKHLKAKQLLRNWKKRGCEICGYSRCLDALDAHHIDEKTNQANLIKNPLTLLKELKKCICLCSNCHREVHAGMHNLIPAPTPQHIEVQNVLPLFKI